MVDIIVVGGGPAGLSAAITARQRNHSVTIITGNMEKSGLYKARRVDNYPGIPGATGAELLNAMTQHALEAGAQLVHGQVSNILPMGDAFFVGYGAEVLDTICVILAVGIVQISLFPGEEELLGRGVSYCATCDGMLFRGKRVCVIGTTHEADEEAGYLASLGCDVVRLSTKNIRILGESSVTSVEADGEEIACAGAFILRQAVAPHLMLSGIETAGAYIVAGASGETNIPGAFAAGDCTGAPHQVAKAAGQGLVAALSASDYIRKM